MSSRSDVVEKLGPNVPGAIVIHVVAMLDLVVLVALLLHILLTVVAPSYARCMASDKERGFLTSPCGLYIACLLTSNFISALGGVFEVEWIVSQEITRGSTCTTQAFFFQLGGNAAALWLGVISMSALSTFMYKSRSLPTWAALVTIAFLWILMVVFDGTASAIFADNSNQFFYGIAGLWCWITPSHRLARLFTQYIWMWFWSAVSVVCFTLVYLCVRGNIVVRQDQHGRQIKWKKGYSGSWLSKSEEYQGLVGAVGKTMCWYPISYITLMIPISVSRIAETFGFPVPVYALVFAAVNALLVGIVNALIYLALRHSLKRSSSSEDTLQGGCDSDKIGSDESFEVPERKRPSAVTISSNPYAWTPVPSTSEWIQPAPHRSISSDAPPRQMPVDTALLQSLHRSVQSIRTVTSATMLDNESRLTLVDEAEIPMEDARPKVKVMMPPRALVTRRQSNPSPNIFSPSEQDRLTSVPLSPNGPKDDNRSPSGYAGLRAISPDLNSLVDELETTLVRLPSGPPPPPRKHKRTLTPSVPVDVDESDMGSFSDKHPVARDDITPVSIGGIRTRTLVKSSDSLFSSWAARDQTTPNTPDNYVHSAPNSPDTTVTFWEGTSEPSSPKTSDMPMHPDAHPLPRDTMLTFWAAYEESSPPLATQISWATDAVSVESEAAKSVKHAARSSQELRRKYSSALLSPPPNAAGRTRALPSEEVPPLPPPNDDASIKLAITKPVAALRPNPANRRSRILNSPPTTSQPSSLGMHRPAASATARCGSPGIQLGEGPPKHTPTALGLGYRPSCPKPGYV